MAGATGQQDDDVFEDVRADEERALWQLFRSYGRSERPQFLLGGIASVISRSTELVPAFILGIVIDSLFFNSRPFTLPLVPDSWLPTSTWNQLWLAIGIIGCAYLLGAVLGWANSWAWNHFSQHLQHTIRTDTYDTMQELELGFFDNKQTGEIISILNNDVNQLEQFLTTRLNTGIRIIVRVGGMGVVMLLLNWQLALLPVIIIPALGLASYQFVKFIHPKYQEVRSSVGALNSRLENNISGIEVIKAYNMEAFESDRVAGASHDYLDAQWDAITTRIKFFPALRIITAAGYVATLIVGGIWVIFGAPGPFSGTLTAGTLVTFLLYTRRFMWPMRQFGEVLNDYQYAEAASERILGLLDEPRVISEAPDAGDLEHVEGRVEYDDISFQYDHVDENSGEEQSEPVLTDISFTAEPGEYIGLVGPTGAGKTTLMKLLLRMYDIDESDGSIRIDGTDIRDVTIDSLRTTISYVSQESFLFYGTVRENIAYGRPDTDDERVRAAAQRAGAHEFVEELPDGYETMVGERGVKLSGGQRQRISLARAILRDPDILILDEATSHVDNETEVLIQNSLDDLIEDRTTFAIAHRLSTVRDADQILVLDDGDLVEQGTHEELLATDGLYANLWSVQVGELDALPQEFIDRTAQRQAQPQEID
jgi:ATP-binding cassette subfamily B protein